MSSNNQDITEQDLKGGSGPTGFLGSRSISRRKMLGSLAAGTVVLGVPGVAAAQEGGLGRRDGRGRVRGRDGRRNTGGSDGAAQTASAPRGATATSGSHTGSTGTRQFTRIFNGVDGFDDVDDELTTMLAKLGAPGGILDAKDSLDEGPIRLITEPELSANNANNPNHTAGTTFMGQFLDHDITRDAGSTLGRRTSLRRSTNLRSAQFDLDSVYGGDPTDSPQLYRPDDNILFRVETGGLFEDLPRNSQGQAIIADARNDENLMIAGIQVAFLKFHNAVVERVRTATDLDGDAAFAEARRIVTWHYQWLILHQFLPQFIGQALVNDILANGRQHYTTLVPTIPVEFQTAAYRFGHSMIRPSYRANLAGDKGEAFFGMVFDPSEFGKSDPGDMTGGCRAPRRFIGWQTFFDFGDGEVKPNKKIDTHLSTPLFQLPMGTIDSSRGEPIGPTSLATRNLLRHITWGIPSGQRVAELMGAPRLAANDLVDINEIVPRLAGETPLWLYILREADLIEDGRRLGPVGGRIVGEVFIGLLQMDPNSILNAGVEWSPTLPSRAGSGEFRMADMLTIAGVDPDTRGQ